jgi:hypothetical protein
MTAKEENDFNPMENFWQKEQSETILRFKKILQDFVKKRTLYYASARFAT